MRTVDEIRRKYEDDGLLPDEYKKLTTADIAKMRLDIKFLLKQIDAFAKAQAEGRIVTLPCKVGDTVYSPRQNDVLEQKVEFFSIGDGEDYAQVSFECDGACEKCPFYAPYTNHEAGDGGCDGECGYGIIYLKDFGKTVFLTREAAENALGGTEG